MNHRCAINWVEEQAKTAFGIDAILLSMTNDNHICLERLCSLHKSQMRKAASAEGIHLVHLEILQYLSVCNKYSNTAQAMSEYLGQTKGSISQSLKVVESAGHIVRKPCKKDGRVIKIELTKQGKACLARIERKLNIDTPDDPAIASMIEQILRVWQNKAGLEGFGQCKSCQFNVQPGDQRFQCGLTGESLSKSDTHKICKEHQFKSFDQAS